MNHPVLIAWLLTVIIVITASLIKDIQEPTEHKQQALVMKYRTDQNGLCYAVDPRGQLTYIDCILLRSLSLIKE